MPPLWLDVSNYDYSTFDAACLRAAAVEGVIVGCQRPGDARVMIARSLAAGLPVKGVYGFLYFGLDTLGQTRAAIAVAREAGIGRVWLDVESVPPHEAPGITPEQRIRELWECVHAVEAAGLAVGIYTGGWYWPHQMANTTEFSRYPLWHAAYFADRRGVREVNYGGWREVAIHQYASDIVLCGRVRDHNYVWIEPDAEAAVTREEYENLALAMLAGGEEVYPDDHPDPELRGRLRPREERLANALYRIGEKATGRAPSVAERAEQRVAATGKVPPHKHELGIVHSQTGGVTQ